YPGQGRSSYLLTVAGCSPIKEQEVGNRSGHGADLIEFIDRKRHDAYIGISTKGRTQSRKTTHACWNSDGAERILCNCEWGDSCSNGGCRASAATARDALLIIRISHRTEDSIVASPSV